VDLVDAAMRQLLEEGWMLNRARLVAASYLTRTLELDRRLGAAHLDRHLVDGDPASNIGNWQWVAGTGANPRRGTALNSDRQARRFDPGGEYVARYQRRSTAR
jgi:deoxyribodipyrimidine photo-lyase